MVGLWQTSYDHEGNRTKDCRCLGTSLFLAVENKNKPKHSSTDFGSVNQNIGGGDYRIVIRGLCRDAKTLTHRAFHFAFRISSPEYFLVKPNILF